MREAVLSSHVDVNAPRCGVNRFIMEINPLLWLLIAISSPRKQFFIPTSWRPSVKPNALAGRPKPLQSVSLQKMFGLEQEKSPKIRPPDHNSLDGTQIL